jgi:hypothetical protein
VTGYDALKKTFPYLEEEATVEVHGKPGSKLNDLYFLGLATAFGMCKRIDALAWASPPTGLLMVECDYADNWVRVTLRQTVSLMSAAAESSVGGLWEKVKRYGTWVANNFDELAGAGRPEPLPPAPGTRELPIIQKPIMKGLPETIIGHPWSLTGEYIPGIPANATSVGVPKFDFEGRTILTRSPTCIDPNPALPVNNTSVIGSPNPKPAGDNRSRGAIPISGGDGKQIALAALVFSALSNPGSANEMLFPQPTSGPKGG